MSKAISEARRVMREAFDADGDFRYGYVANIACLIHDKMSWDKKKYALVLLEDNKVGFSWAATNELAEKIVDLIFYDKRN